jgi:hypothetical protein
VGKRGGECQLLAVVQYYCLTCRLPCTAVYCGQLLVSVCVCVCAAAAAASCTSSVPCHAHVIDTVVISSVLLSLTCCLQVTDTKFDLSNGQALEQQQEEKPEWAAETVSASYNTVWLAGCCTLCVSAAAASCASPVPCLVSSSTLSLAAASHLLLPGD